MAEFDGTILFVEDHKQDDVEIDIAVKDGLFSVIVLLMASDVMIQEPGAFADISDIVNGMP